MIISAEHIPLSDPFRSERLFFKAYEEEDKPVLIEMRQNAQEAIQSIPSVPRPQGTKHSKGFFEWLDTCLLVAVPCISLPAPDGSDEAPKLTPIGYLALTHCVPGQEYKRQTTLGISIVTKYHGQGYGSEAIKWALDWSFRRANMHKVMLWTLEFNEGAARLYQKLGFKLDGRFRDDTFHDGRYWDTLHMSMLEGEWREMYGGQSKKVQVNGVHHP